MGETRTFGALLRQHRLAASLSQEVLGERAQLSVNAIAALERGRRTAPRPGTVAVLADALCLTSAARAALIGAARPGGPAESNAGSSPPLMLSSLPVLLTNFIGRGPELAEISRLLRGTRLLTLTGSGGVGKTRLALRLAEDRLHAYPDGVTFVDLAPLHDSALVVQAVGAGLGVREQPVRSLLESIAQMLESGHVLLVLDNCEHLVQACADMADALLRACPALTILATSRQPLGISGEVAWRVPSLSLPWPPNGAALDAVSDSEAALLFVERARAALPGFAVTEQNAHAIAEVCHRLDGIPLAVELAAAWVGVLSVEHLAARLDDRFRLLVSGSRTALPRQQTLRGTVDWSHGLLTGPEQMLFRRLAVFAGRWTAEAAEEICVGDGLVRADVLELLRGLVDKSMVVAEPWAADARYRLLETLRQYAREKLRTAGEAAELHGRHLDWYVGLAERAEPHLRGPQQRLWLDRLDQDYDNLRAALDWSTTAAEHVEAGLRLASALHPFWDLRGYISEGRRWLARTMEGATSATSSMATALFAAGYLAVLQGEYATARSQLERALMLYRELGDKLGASNVLNWLGLLLVRIGDDSCQAKALLEESLALARELGSTNHIDLALVHLGDVAQAQGDYQRASVLYEQSLTLTREQGDQWITARTLFSMGHLARLQADYDRATALLQESLCMRQALEDRRGIALCLDALATVAAGEGRLERASGLFGAAETLLETLGAAVFPQWQAAHEQGLAATRTGLAPATFEAAREAVRNMPVEEVVAYALTPEDGWQSLLSRSRRTAAADEARLTPREQEVAALLAHGLSNRQLAAELVITAGTAALHVKHILGKLGFTSRAQITAWAVRQDLIPASEHETARPSASGKH